MLSPIATGTRVRRGEDAFPDSVFPRKLQSRESRRIPYEQSSPLPSTVSQTLGCMSSCRKKTFPAGETRGEAMVSRTTRSAMRWALDGVDFRLACRRTACDRHRRTCIDGRRVVLLLALGIPSPESRSIGQEVHWAMRGFQMPFAGIDLREGLRLCGGGSSEAGDNGAGSLWQARDQQPWLMDGAFLCSGRGAVDRERIRLALRILNSTLGDMEKSRAMGMRGAGVAERICMICGSSNVRLGVTWRGIRHFAMSTSESSEVFCELCLLLYTGL